MQGVAAYLGIGRVCKLPGGESRAASLYVGQRNASVAEGDHSQGPAWEVRGSFAKSSRYPDFGPDPHFRSGV